MDLKKHNLFEFATSELSQDAFICWLLSFACEKYEQQDPALCECAYEILAHMIPNSEGLIITDIIRQFKNIDVLLEVKDKNNHYYNVIIEDKTFTAQHDDQIRNYVKTIEDLNSLHEKTENSVVSVYFKIIEQCYPEKVHVHIDRQYLLGIFSKYIGKTNNSIFKDYFEHLQKIEKSVKSYLDLTIDKWEKENYHAYKGFFLHLKKDIISSSDEECGWGYVHNPSGGFNGFWWNYLRGANLISSNLESYLEKVYLQIENDTIAVKIVGNHELSSKIRLSLFDYIDKKIVGFKRPKHFRKGKCMTVGRVKYDTQNYKEQIANMQILLDSIRDGDYKFVE